MLIRVRAYLTEIGAKWNVKTLYKGVFRFLGRFVCAFVWLQSLQNSQNKEQNLFTTFTTSIKIQKLVADFESVDKISKQFFTQQTSKKILFFLTFFVDSFLCINCVHLFNEFESSPIFCMFNIPILIVCKKNCAASEANKPCQQSIRTTGFSTTYILARCHLFPPVIV
jgi:hypothetical protein